jgi:hypothetical protein
MYKNLSTENQRMWDMKCVIPVTIEATDLINKVIKEYLETVPGKRTIDST